MTDDGLEVTAGLAEGPAPGRVWLEAEQKGPGGAVRIRVERPLTSPDGTMVRGAALFSWDDGGEVLLEIRNGFFCCSCGEADLEREIPGTPFPCDHVAFYVSEVQKMMEEGS